MAAHVEYLRQSATKALSILRKEAGTNKSAGLTVSTCRDPTLIDIVEESFVMDPSAGKKIPIRRIFVASVEGGAYNDVGWVVHADLEACMLCKQGFGTFFSSKYSCHACGNVCCASCSSQTAYIFEIQTLGPLKVCALCCYGQELVYAVPRVIPEPPKPPVLPVHRQSTSEELAQDEAAQKRKSKVAKHVEFQREALARIGNRGSFGLAGLVLEERRSSLGRNGSILSKYSAQMVSVTPAVGFVVKTKRLHTGVKVFLNITKSDRIPYAGSGVNTKVCMVVNTPCEGSKDDGHGGSVAFVMYDFLVHPDEVYVATIDSTGQARERLSKQCIDMLIHGYGEELESTHTFPHSAYKGQDEVSHVLPSHYPELTFFLNCAV